MTTRTNTPAPRDDRPRLVLRDKPREAASMEGWRIEVRKLKYGPYPDWAIERANGETVSLRIYEWLLTPMRYFNATCTNACADVLFETIYVDRDLNATEADTLRRLMAEECGRERLQETVDTAVLLAGEKIAEAALFGYSETTQADVDHARDRVRAMKAGEPTHITLNYTAPVLTDAERAQLGAALRNAGRRDVVLTADGPIERGQLVTQTAEGKAGAVVRKHCDCGVALGDCSHDAPDVERSEACRCGRRWFHDASGWRASRPGDLGHQPAPRVPQVGDEVEVQLAPGNPGEWERCRVLEVNAADESYRVHFGWCSFRGWWRWPEAKREAQAPRRAEPPHRASRGCLTFDAAIGTRGAWRMGICPGSLTRSISYVIEHFDRCDLAFVKGDHRHIEPIEGGDPESTTMERLRDLFRDGWKVATA